MFLSNRLGVRYKSFKPASLPESIFHMVYCINCYLSAPGAVSQHQNVILKEAKMPIFAAVIILSISSWLFFLFFLHLKSEQIKIFWEAIKKHVYLQRLCYGALMTQNVRVQTY